MRRPKAPRPAELLTFAHHLADRAGKVILPYFRRRLAVDNKAGAGEYDPVTAADRAAERVIAREIRRRFPEHGIVGEEFGDTNPSARLKWVIDPIDGTRSFVTGSPLWGTLIGLTADGAPVLGLADMPFTRERWWAADGAAFRSQPGSSKPVRTKTRSCGALADAALMTTSLDFFKPGAEAEAFLRLRAKARLTRFGGDCYAYCQLATGFIDLVVETGLQTYDIVALIPIIERAGGVVTSWDGGSAIGGGRVVAAGDKRLHETVLKLLNR